MAPKKNKASASSEPPSSKKRKIAHDATAARKLDVAKAKRSSLTLGLEKALLDVNMFGEKFELLPVLQLVAGYASVSYAMIHLVHPDDNKHSKELFERVRSHLSAIPDTIAGCAMVASDIKELRDIPNFPHVDMDDLLRSTRQTVTVSFHVETQAGTLATQKPVSDKERRRNVFRSCTGGDDWVIELIPNYVLSCFRAGSADEVEHWLHAIRDDFGDLFEDLWVGVITKLHNEIYTIKENEEKELQTYPSDLFPNPQNLACYWTLFDHAIELEENCETKRYASDVKEFVRLCSELWFTDYKACSKALLGESVQHSMFETHDDVRFHCTPFHASEKHKKLGSASQGPWSVRVRITSDDIPVDWSEHGGIFSRMFEADDSTWFNRFEFDSEATVALFRKRWCENIGVDCPENITRFSLSLFRCLISVPFF